VEGIACSWCHYPNEPGRVSCGTCGAPLDVANAVSEGFLDWHRSTLVWKCSGLTDVLRAISRSHEGDSQVTFPVTVLSPPLR
jgi:hypothetical protein